MGSRVIYLTRPEGGAERDVTFETLHKCPQGDAVRGFLDDPDLLMFPVGLFGWEMTADTPFVVETPIPCAACGNTVKAWFVWSSPTVVSHKIWRPGDE